MIRTGPGIVAVAAVALALIATGCGGRAQREWAREWGERADAGPRFGTGSEFVIAVHEGTPAGTRTRRFRYTLKEIRETDGVFACTTDDGTVREATHRMNPAVPAVPMYGGQSPPRVYPYAEPFRKVRVPAGRYRCGRTWKSRTRGDGLVLRIDEWWAPNVPFAVQRWERAEVDVNEGFYDPPAAPESVPIGTEWTVLEQVVAR